MPGANGRWQVFEISADGTGLRQLTLATSPTWTTTTPATCPTGGSSSARRCFTGVPCVYGASHVANLYLLDADGRNIRQLSFDQDHDWCPTVLNNGRVLYSPLGIHRHAALVRAPAVPHEPDGTEQMEYYGSNSYWPNSIFYARPIPGPSDQGRGRRRRATTTCRAWASWWSSTRPGGAARPRARCSGSPATARGRADHPRRPWPTQLAQVPPPLSAERQVLPRLLQARRRSRSGASTWSTCSTTWCCSRRSRATRCSSRSRCARRRRPPVHPGQGRPRPASDAVVYLADIYRGDGLRGRAPRHGQAAAAVSATTSPTRAWAAEPAAWAWTAPGTSSACWAPCRSSADGSANFRVPANTPIAVQPLDAEGKAVQLMRSWFTAMPGEVVSCVGCHEPQNTAPPVRQTLAAAPAAGRDQALARAGRGVQLPPRGAAGARPLLRRLPRRPAARRRHARCAASPTGSNVADPLNPNRHNQAARFSPSYYHLRRFVRTPARRATCTCSGRGSSTPTRPAWSRCSAKGTTTSGSTPRRGTGWSRGST